MSKPPSVWLGSPCLRAFIQGHLWWCLLRQTWWQWYVSSVNFDGGFDGCCEEVASDGYPLTVFNRVVRVRWTLRHADGDKLGKDSTCGHWQTITDTQDFQNHKQAQYLQGLCLEVELVWNVAVVFFQTYHRERYRINPKFQLCCILIKFYYIFSQQTFPWAFLGSHNHPVSWNRSYVASHRTWALYHLKVMAIDCRTDSHYNNVANLNYQI